MDSLFPPKPAGEPAPASAPAAPPADDGLVAQLAANPLFTGVGPPPAPRSPLSTPLSPNIPPPPAPADPPRESA